MHLSQVIIDGRLAVVARDGAEAAVLPGVASTYALANTQFEFCYCARWRRLCGRSGH
jgi:hypothetical protein